MRKEILLVLVPALAAGLDPSVGFAADAITPLRTRWADDIQPDRVLPEYPRPQLARERWLNLNGTWEFAEAKEGDFVPAGKTLAERILVPFPIESALSGIARPIERAWYRRTFTVPVEWAGGRIMLRFGAVDWETAVYVNGSKVGAHQGGYDPFGFDITAALSPDGPQELVVGIFDPSDKGSQPRGKQVKKPEGIWYTPSSGIWQTVWLEPVPPVHIESLRIVPDLDKGVARVTARVAGAEAKAAQIELVASAEGKEVGRAAGASGQEIELKLAQPIAWTPVKPFLYDLTATCRAGDKADRVSSYFGLRKVSVGKDAAGVTRLLLNGEFVFQAGPLDQGFWPDGLYTAPTDEALRFDIEATKELGFNMTRKHVKVEPDRWYYWCDKLGLLVWQDMPSADNKTPESKKQFELELARMIDALENHPSIVLWVVFNEGWGQYDTERISQWVKERDPSRWVNSASGWHDRRVGDMIDAHVYPGPGARPAEERRASVLGEFGGLSLGVDGHTWTQKIWGYQGTSSNAELTRKYEHLWRGVWNLRDKSGLSAAIYTQLTDVESECNGLYTYDRAVRKVDLERARDANQGRPRPAPKRRTVVPTALDQPARWRYSTSPPEGEWAAVAFDDSSWMTGTGGFGTEGTPGSKIGTNWNTKEIWLRRVITVGPARIGDLQFLVHHDEDVEIYLNGVLAGKATGFVTEYDLVDLTSAGRAALKPGENVMAVYCKQTGGGQYIDVGLVELEE